MAIMIDNKPSYSGEGLTWECLSQNLPNDVVVYTHKEVVSGDECDFALLIKNRGILIIEVKGWEAKYIYDVTNSGQIILTNDSLDEKKVQGSPRVQARKYRFQWLNYIQDRLGFSPLILHMVCYPFITEQQYRDTRLDTISDSSITLFVEDIKSSVRLGQKIDNWFNVKRGISSIVFDDSYMCQVRQCFEPSFKPNKEEQKKVSESYSFLKIYGRDFRYEDEDEAINAYFNGTKIILFVHQQKEIEHLAWRMQSELNKRSLIAEKGAIRLAHKEEAQKDLYDASLSELRLFNFEAYYVEDDLSLETDIVISEGEFQDADRDVLKKLDAHTNFNFMQYQIEHASTDENILVRAGAGTGKTYSMVSRIAFLCNTKKMAVYNLVDDIAMVTFTNEAADNMKERLKQAFMSYYLLTQKKRFLHEIESVDLMQISTIHKFAKSIIQASSVSYGLGFDFSITSSAYAKEQVYEEFLDAYLVKKKAEDSNISRKLRMPVHKFRKLLMDFSKQLFDKSCDIKTILPEEFGTFDELPFFNEVIEKVIIPAEEKYHESITEKNKIDLKESMILLNNAVNGIYRSKCDVKYKYLFIDEFQDTDDVQIDSFLRLQEIIQGIHLFIVGDIKQSIYRFRGATDSAFNQILSSETKWHEFTLTTNYRTDARLLKLFDTIFTRMGRNGYLKFKPGKDTLSSNIYTGIDDAELITKVEYSADEDGQFMDVLFDVIEREKQRVQLLEEKKPLGEKEKTIAILVRENWQIEAILEESRKRKIFIQTEIGGDLYQLAPALDLYKLILALMSPKDPTVLYNLIMSNYVNVEIDIQGLHGKRKSEKSQILIAALDKYFLQCYQKDWNAIVKETRVKPVLVLLRDLYEVAQPWLLYDSDETRQKFYRANYELTLEKIIKAFSVDYLTLNVIESSLHINILTRQEVLARNVASNKDEIGVICTTVHKAKGLEYGTVIIPYGNADISSMSKSALDVVYSNHKLAYGMRIDGPMKYYNSNYDTREEKSQRVQEESRVFYVALTRAIRNVVWLKDTASNSAISWQKLVEE